MLELDRRRRAARRALVRAVGATGRARRGRGRRPTASSRGGRAPGRGRSTFRDGYFPDAGQAEIKEWFESCKARSSPDLILTHARDDAHQDHREVSQLTWNTFRDHLILEYEIPKWDGDLGQPERLRAADRGDRGAQESTLLTSHFGTQRSKDWFDEETFRGLARLRGMECRAPDRYAEAFHVRKLRLI